MKYACFCDAKSDAEQSQVHNSKCMQGSRQKGSGSHMHTTSKQHHYRAKFCSHLGTYIINTSTRMLAEAVWHGVVKSIGSYCKTAHNHNRGMHACTQPPHPAQVQPMCVENSGLKCGRGVTLGSKPRNEA